MSTYGKRPYPLRGERRRSRVQTAHADRPGSECFAPAARRLRRPLRGRDGDEERVALRVDLDTAVRG
jgi:hypothetical protein